MNESQGMLFEVVPPLPCARPERITRREDPDTSRDAARGMVESGKLMRQQIAVLRWIREFPGLTTAELAVEVEDNYRTAQQLLGDDWQQYKRPVFGRRVGELVKAGVVFWLPRRPCRIGQPARPCRITRMGELFLDLQPLEDAGDKD